MNREEITNLYWALVDLGLVTDLMTGFDIRDKIAKDQWTIRVRWQFGFVPLDTVEKVVAMFKEHGVTPMFDKEGLVVRTSNDWNSSSERPYWTPVEYARGDDMISKEVANIQYKQLAKEAADLLGAVQASGAAAMFDEAAERGLRE